MHMTLDQENDIDLVQEIRSVCEQVRSALRKAEQAARNNDAHLCIEHLRSIQYLTEDFQ